MGHKFPLPLFKHSNNSLLLGVGSDLSLLNKIVVNFGDTILGSDSIVVDIGKSPLIHRTVSQIGADANTARWFEQFV